MRSIASTKNFSYTKIILHKSKIWNNIELDVAKVNLYEKLEVEILLKQYFFYKICKPILAFLFFCMAIKWKLQVTNIKLYKKFSQNTHLH